MKKSFVYISLLLLFAFATPNITVLAAPEQTEDTEETEETEEETEEETNDDGGEWKEQDGIFTIESDMYSMGFVFIIIIITQMIISSLFYLFVFLK